MPYVYEPAHSIPVRCISLRSHHLSEPDTCNIPGKLHILFALLLIQPFAGSTVVISRIVSWFVLLVTMLKEQLVLRSKDSAVKFLMLGHKCRIPVKHIFS